MCQSYWIERFIFLLLPLHPPPAMPTETYSNHIEAIENIPFRHDDKVFVLGDFKLPNIKWYLEDDDDSLIGTNVRSESESLITDFFSNNGFMQINGIQNCSGNLLDLIFTTDADNIDITLAKTPLTKVEITTHR